MMNTRADVPRFLPRSNLTYVHRVQGEIDASPDHNRKPETHSSSAIHASWRRSLAFDWSQWNGEDLFAGLSSTDRL